MMSLNYIRVVAFLTAMALAVHTHAMESSDERVTKIEQVTQAFQKNFSRRLKPADNSDSGDELEKLTELYSLIWRGDQLAVRVTYSGDKPDADTKLKKALEKIDGFDVDDCRLYMCSGWCDLRNIDEVELLPEVIFIDPSSMPVTDAASFGSGSISTQAIAATQVKKVLQKYPELTGAGMKIGIISDSFDQSSFQRTTEADDIASGDLPGGSKRVKILDDNSPFVNILSDEGRVIAQLIYDIAPDAEIFFHTGFLIGNNFAAAIEALVEEGCDVIVDDVRANVEAKFQLGFSALAAKKAAEENGVAYFTSVQNLASRSWEARGYIDTPCPDLKKVRNDKYISCHDFGDGNPLQRINIVDGKIFLFFWDDAWQSLSGPPGPQTDLDIFLYDTENGKLKYSGDQPNLNNDALESFVVTEPGTYDLVIAKRSGPSPSIIKWIARGLGDTDPLGTAPTAYSTGNAPGTAAVGAASEKQTFSELLLQPFSSLGGIPLIFDEEGNRRAEELVLEVPRFVGPDSSYNTFFGARGLEFEINENRRNTPPRFVGTSCAAANVAAVGVILLQAISLFSQEGRRLQSNTTDNKGVLVDNGFLLPYDIYNILEETAIDMNEPGFDFLTGYGFINAFDAVETIKDRITTAKHKKPSNKSKSSKSSKSSTKKSQKSSKKSPQKSSSDSVEESVDETVNESCTLADFTDPIEEYFTDFLFF